MASQEQVVAPGLAIGITHQKEFVPLLGSSFLVQKDSELRLVSV